MASDLASVPGLASNLAVLSDKERALAETLVQAGQKHLFSDWPATPADDDRKHQFFEQVRQCLGPESFGAVPPARGGFPQLIPRGAAQIARLDSSYPGGVSGYCENARALLAASSAGKNPFEGLTPHVRARAGRAALDTPLTSGTRPGPPRPHVDGRRRRFPQGRGGRCRRDASRRVRPRRRRPRGAPGASNVLARPRRRPGHAAGPARHQGCCAAGIRWDQGRAARGAHHQPLLPGAVHPPHPRLPSPGRGRRHGARPRPTRRLAGCWTGWARGG